MTADKLNICTRPTIHHPPYIKLLIFLTSLIVFTQQQCCTKFQNKKCVQCPSGAHLYMNNCLLDVENCVRYAGGFYCTKCSEGYELMDDNACVGILKEVNVTEGDVEFSGFVKMSKQEILADNGNFNDGFNLLLAGKDIIQYKKEQILYLFSKEVQISSRSLQIYRMIVQTKTGFDDLLFAYDPLLSISKPITKKSFNKLTSTQPNYSYIDLKSEQIHEFILSQIEGMDEFIKEGKSVYDQCEELDSYMVEKQVNGQSVDSFLIYFVNRDYGLIEVSVDLQVFQTQTQQISQNSLNNKTANGTANGTVNGTTTNYNTKQKDSSSINNSTNEDSTKTNKTQNSSNSQTTQEPKQNITYSDPIPSPKNQTISLNNTQTTNSSDKTNQTSIQNNKTANTTSNAPTINNSSTTTNQTQPSYNQTTNSSKNSSIPSPSDPNIVFFHSLLSMFNYTSIQNYTTLPENSFLSSPIASKLIDFLIQNRPTLTHIHHPTTNVTTTDYLLDSAYKMLSARDILQMQKQRGVVQQQTIDQFQKDIALDSYVCLIVRLTYQIEQLQPYQIKTIIVAKLNNNRSLDSFTIQNDINSTTVSLMKIVEQIGRPQTTFIDSTISPPPSLSQQVITYPQKQQQFIQRVQFFLQLQYPELMQSAQLLNVTYQEFSKLPQEIRNMSSIKDAEIRKIEEKNVFGNLYRIYVFLFAKGEAEQRKEFRWKLQFKDNQLDILETPKEAISTSSDGAGPIQSDGPINGSSVNSTQQSPSKTNSTTTNSSTTNTSSDTTPTPTTSTPVTTITSDTSPQQQIYINLLTNDSTPITDRYIMQLDKLVKSFYSSQLNNNQSGKYSLVLVGMKTKDQINTTVTFDPLTNQTRSTVTRTEDQKVYRLWYVLNRFMRDNNTTSQQQNDSQKVYGYEMGVSTKGLVTLYKVNVIKRSQFVTQFSDCINGNATNSQNSKTNGTSLKEFFIINQNLQPNTDSFTTNKIFVDTTLQKQNIDEKEKTSTDSKSQNQNKINSSNSSRKNEQTNIDSKVQQTKNQSQQQINVQLQEDTKIQATPTEQNEEIKPDSFMEKPGNQTNSSTQVGQNETQVEQQPIKDSLQATDKVKIDEVNNQTFIDQTASKQQNSQSTIATSRQGNTNDLANNFDIKVNPNNNNNSNETVQSQTHSVDIVEPKPTSTQISSQPSFQPTAQTFLLPIYAINSSFTSMQQFRRSDSNFVKLYSFIKLVDPSKESSTQSDIKTIYRIRWENNFLRYLVIFKNGSPSANESQISSKNDRGNDTFYDESALYVFELQVQKNQSLKTTNEMMNSEDKVSHDDTTGEVVILSINDETKEKEYQDIIKASNSNASDNGKNNISIINNNNIFNTTSQSTSISDYYYYDKSSSPITTSIKGAALQEGQQQKTTQNKQQFGKTDQIAMKNRILQELMEEIEKQEVSNINGGVQALFKKNNPIVLSDTVLNSYPSLSHIKGDSIAKSDNLRKEDPVSKITSPTPSPINKSTSSDLIPQTRKKLGLLQISTLNEKTLINNAKPTESESQLFNNSFRKRFSQKSTEQQKSSNNQQPYSLITVLLQLPSVNNNTNKSINRDKSINLTDDQSFSNLIGDTKTDSNTTFTLSLHSFNISVNSQLLSSSNNFSQKLISIHSSSVLNKQNYRFGKVLTPNKKIDEFIKKEEQKYQLQSHEVKMEGNMVNVPKKIAMMDPYFKASQQFVIWDNVFFLKSYAQKDITIAFISNKDKNLLQSSKSSQPSRSSQSPQQKHKNSSSTPQQLQYIKLITNLQTVTSTAQSSKQISQFQSFMSKHFKFISYTVRYIVANYDKLAADQFVIKMEYNDATKRYDVVEMKLTKRYSLKQIQNYIEQNHNFSTIDPTLNCQIASKQYKLKCLKCHDNYLLTDFQSLFVASQPKQADNVINSPTVCSKQIPNCKYQFLDTCVQCSDGYQKLKDKNSQIGENPANEHCAKIFG